MPIDPDHLFTATLQKISPSSQQRARSQRWLSRRRAKTRRHGSSGCSSPAQASPVFSLVSQTDCSTSIVYIHANRASWFIGYDTGVISGALVTINSDLGPAELSSGQKELITSATTLGALIGGLVAGMLSDFVGRKPVLGISDVIFIGGAVGQAVCHTVWSMVRLPLPIQFLRTRADAFFTQRLDVDF